MKRAVVALLAGAVLVAGCGRRSPGDVADDVTRKVYAGDVAGVRTALAADVRGSVTPSSVASLARRMRDFGDYRGLVQVSTIPEERRYDFEAQFVRGSMLVQLRLGDDGHVAAYRVIPNPILQ